MGDHGHAADLVKNFGQRGAHSLSVAGREDNGRWAGWHGCWSTSALKASQWPVTAPSEESATTGTSWDASRTLPWMEISRVMPRVVRVASMAMLGALCLGASDITRLRQPVTTDGLLGVAATDTVTPGEVAGSASFLYGLNPLVWRYDDATYEPVIEHQLTMQIGAAIGVLPFVDVAVALPILLIPGRACAQCD